MKETRVGHATTSVLEDMAEEIIRDAWRAKDYECVVEYITKYNQLREYNGKGGVL